MTLRTHWTKKTLTCNGAYLHCGIAAFARLNDLSTSNSTVSVLRSEHHHCHHDNYWHYHYHHRPNEEEAELLNLTSTFFARCIQCLQFLKHLLSYGEASLPPPSPPAGPQTLSSEALRQLRSNLHQPIKKTSQIMPQSAGDVTAFSHVNPSDRKNPLLCSHRRNLFYTVTFSKR